MHTEERQWYWIGVCVAEVFRCIVMVMMNWFAIGAPCMEIGICCSMCGRAPCMKVQKRSPEMSDGWRKLGER